MMNKWFVAQPSEAWLALALIQLSASIAQIEKFTGRTAPDVIT
jgi:hypothetical protein